jgi:hypothetical protein
MSSGEARLADLARNRAAVASVETIDKVGVNGLRVGARISFTDGSVAFVQHVRMSPVGRETDPTELYTDRG